MIQKLECRGQIQVCKLGWLIPLMIGLRVGFSTWICVYSFCKRSKKDEKEERWGFYFPPILLPVAYPGLFLASAGQSPTLSECIIAGP
jgi:hypothetical protein